MWIFLNDAMLSIVAHRAKPNHLMVRARRKGEIERIFPGAKEIRTADADYLFRAVIKREEVAGVLFSESMSIDYPNFKSSVTDKARHDAYMGVWSVMKRYQDDSARKVYPRACQLDLSDPFEPFDPDVDLPSAKTRKPKPTPRRMARKDRTS